MATRLKTVTAASCHERYRLIAIANCADVAFFFAVSVRGLSGWDWQQVLICDQPG